MIAWRALVFVAAGCFAAGCGYHVVGRADLLPKQIKTIAVPAFGNVTTRYKLADQLAAAVTRELITRTRYQVVADPGQADAVLQGAVANIFTFPTLFDPTTGRAAGVQMSVVLQITLRERATGTLLYNQPALEFRERYEISTDPLAYFDESSPALERLSREVARGVVSAILESF